jgi:hypothetical protein
MPDFTIENYWVCFDLAYFQTKIEGNAGTYTVTCIKGQWHCDCLAYKYNKGWCKHIKQANNKRCSWHQHHEGGEPIEKEDGTKCCPQCGGSVLITKCAV